jgi:YidC/Oxa1 family membrane protein insertase
MSSIFNEIIYRPIFNLLIFLYNVVPFGGIGMAIILLTLLIKILLWPFAQKALKSQKALMDLQPKVDELKKQFGDNKEGMAQALMQLYSREKVSPASSCLPILIQLPLLIALYHALSKGIQSSGFEALYPFIANPGKIDGSFFGLFDLKKASPILALLAGVTQFFQAKMMVSRQQPPSGDKVKGAEDEQMLATMNKQMTYIMPVVTTVIAWNLPGGLGLYWVTTSIFTIVQQHLFFRGHAKNKDTKVDPNKPVEVEIIPPKTTK